MLLAAFIILILLGLALIAIGLRGRIARHGPTCRACTFDLSGLATPLVTCPECGKSLALPRAVRPSLRRRRGIPLVIGLLILVTLGAAATVATRASFATPATQAKLPAWVLGLEMKYASPTLAEAASKELCTRIANGAVDGASMRALVDWCLDVHSDRAISWTRSHAKFVERAWSGGLIEAATFGRYLEQAIPISVYAPRVIRQNSVTLVGVHIDGDLIGSSFISPFIQVKALSMKIGDQTVGEPFTTQGGLGSSRSARMEVSASNPIGSHLIEMPLEILVTQGNETSPPIARWTTTITAPVQVVAPDADVLPRRTEPDFASQLRSRLKLVRVGRNDSQLEIEMSTVQALPDIGVQPEIRFRDKDGIEQRVRQTPWRLGQINVGSSHYANGGGTWSALDAAGASGLKKVDVALIASSAIAEECEASEYWSGEVLYEDVSFEYVAPSTAPPDK